ncbi:BamA/TamA family outer membrane protein [Streptobacillus felis]|uniref:BamA/TamA family outer membrane protein n=1 Tax=Streptobacillus felis TaxID=1384509 RepID=A0A7Z0PG01_9FUSO|nr:POTRA domain-containing protein [Streptobacillus felis]NYV27555.1 BamA/TamA family outer membrane protein [Streptobacillus felis]
MKNKILIALLSLGTAIFAAPKINNIEISNLKNLPEEMVRELLPVKEGTEYTNKQLSDIYLALVRTGFIQNVNVYPTEDGENVNLKMVVDEVPNADKIIQNMKEIEELKKKTEFKIGDIVVKGTNQNIQPLIDKTGLKRGEYFTPYDAKLLENLILSSGYFGATEIRVFRTADEKVIDVEVNVLENPVIKSINIKGSSILTEEQLKEISGLKVGDVLNGRLLTLEESPIIRVYSENGFLWVGFKDVTVTKDGDVTIELLEGKVKDVVYEKKGNVKENERISEKDYALKTQKHIFERNTYVKKGEILNQKELEVTLRELFRTGLFASLSHEIIKDSENLEDLTIKIIVTERPTTGISANISYSTEDSLSGSLKLEDTNFLGSEQTFSLVGEAGVKGNYNFSFNFKDPWIKGTDRLLAGGSIYFKKTSVKPRDLEGYKKGNEQEVIDKNLVQPTDKQFVFGINGQIGKGLTKDLYLTVSPRLLNVYSKNKGTDVNSRVYQDYTLLALGSDLIYDSRDDRNTPKKGLYADLFLEGGYIVRDKSLILQKQNDGTYAFAKDDNNNYITQKPRAYFTTSLDLRGYHPVYKDKNSMAYRLLASYSHANTPSGQLTTVGDGITLRGLQTPIVGNQYAVTFTAENRTYINDYLQAVLFYDGGIAQNAVNANGKLKFMNNIGLGARVNTPIGVVRLDYAWDLERKPGTNKSKGKFNFGFGQTF